MPKAPSNYHPTRRTKSATIRRDWVLGEMQQNGFISEAERMQAVAVPLTVVGRSGFDSTDAPYFAEEVRREVVAMFGEEMLYTGGLSVRTTLDPTLQMAARMALERAQREGADCTCADGSRARCLCGCRRFVNNCWQRSRLVHLFNLRLIR